MSEEKRQSIRLPINWRDMERAFEGGNDPAGAEWYLDRATGKRECLVEGDPDSEALRTRLDRDVNRYARVEQPAPEEEVGWMEEFAAGVADQKVRKDLDRALAGAQENSDDSVINCRNFAPLYDIDEESATGTSNCALACYLFKHVEQRDQYVFEQGHCLGSLSRIIVNLSSQDDTITSVSVGGEGYFIEKKSLLID